MNDYGMTMTMTMTMLAIITIYLAVISNGDNRPRHGPIYHAMRMSRAQFKYALRQCILEERSITSTKLAYHMQSHEFNDFGKKLENKTKPNLHFLTVLQELLERLL